VSRVAFAHAQARAAREADALRHSRARHVIPAKAGIQGNRTDIRAALDRRYRA
jgi:hypothetical protein